MVLSCIMMNVSFVSLVELLPFPSYINMYNNLSSCTIIILVPFTCAIDLKALWCSLERMDLIHYSFAPLILFRVPYMLDLLP